MKAIKAGLIIILLLLAAGGVYFFYQSGFKAADTKEPEKQAVKTAATFESRTAETIKLIKDQDWEGLSAVIHPTKGVRLSPYAYVDTEKNLVFTADSIKSAAASDKKYVWGIYDGSGEPIELTFTDYFKRFVYDKDFANAEIGYNKFIGSGNSLNNCKETYPDASFAEYYFPGEDPKYEGMDWKSLRLVFEKDGDTWYLSGIIHDEWTI